MPLDLDQAQAKQFNYSLANIFVAESQVNCLSDPFAEFFNAVVVTHQLYRDGNNEVAFTFDCCYRKPADFEETTRRGLGLVIVVRPTLLLTQNLESGYYNDPVRLNSGNLLVFESKSFEFDSESQSFTYWRMATIGQLGKYKQLDQNIVQLRIEIEIKCQRRQPTVKIEPNSSLSKAMAKIMINEESADVQLVAGNKTFNAHKMILAARSKFFALFFEDKKDNIITVPDCEADIFRAILNYIYTDQLDAPNNVDLAQLASVAYDVFGINELASMCASQMIERLNEKNAPEYLNLAIRWEADDLKRAAVEFISNNKNKI